MLVTIAVTAGANLLSTLTWRYALAAVMLAAVAGGRRGLRMPRERAVRLVALGGGGQAAIAFLSLSALRYIPVGTLAFLFYTYPAWVALIAALRGSERLTPRRLGALGLSLGGIVVMVGAPLGSGPVHPGGALLALGSAILYAIYLPVINHLQRGIAPAAASVFIVTGAGLLLGATALAGGTLALVLTPTAWAAVAALAVISTVLGFIVLLKGLAILGPVRTAIISTVEPFWTAMLGALVLLQPITAATLLGGGLIASAVLLLQWVPRER